MERRGRQSPSNLIENEELSPRHFYAVYEFENAEVYQPQITQVVHKAWDMGYPVRYWWLSEVAELEENPDKLIIGVHHPSQAEDAGLDLYMELVKEQGASWDLWDGVDVREYAGFGIPVENMGAINKPNGLPLFPDLRTTTIEWSNLPGSVALQLQVKESLKGEVPLAVQEKMHHALTEIGYLFATVLENQQSLALAGMDLGKALDAIADNAAHMAHIFAETAVSSEDNQDFPFIEQDEGPDPLEEMAALQQMRANRASEELQPNHDDTSIPKPLFEGGRVLATPKAMEAIEETELEIMDILARHLVGDWGDIDDEEKMLNDQAVEYGKRITSAYRLAPSIEVWVVTAGDRQATWLKLSEQDDPPR